MDSPLVFVPIILDEPGLKKSFAPSFQNYLKKISLPTATPTDPMKKHSLLKTLVAALAVVPLLASAANLTWDTNTAVTGAQDGIGI